MAANQEVMEAMDEAAKKAGIELNSTLEIECVKAVAKWWKNNYMKAGHKRLAKILLKFAED